MSLSVILSLSAIILEVVVLIVAGVWAVGKIRSTSEVLNASVRTLDKTVERLAKTVERLDVKIDNHSERLSRLEALQENNDNHH